MTFQHKIIFLISFTPLFLATLFLLAVYRAQSESSLNSLQIDFGTPTAILPLDRILKHEFTVKNLGSQYLVVDFNIFVKETNQRIVGWPQPQVLYLEPGEQKTVQTFLDELWGRLDRRLAGNHQRTVEWTFRNQKTREERKYNVFYKFTVLDQAKITGDLKVKGRVVNENNEPVSRAQVRISTGPGGWGTQTITDSLGAFSFPGLPARDDWVLETQAGDFRSTIVFLEQNKTDYTLKLKKLALKLSYQIAKAEKTEIGFWKGAVDDSEKYVLLINGMENWQDSSLKSESKLYLYTLDGKLLWTYDMGWEGWGADLSRTGEYAAFVTSNQTRTLGIIKTDSGKPLWVKDAREFGTPQFPALDSKEIKISNTNKYLGVGNGGGGIFLLELDSGKILWNQSLKGQVRGIIFSQDDKFLFAGSGDGNAYKLKIEDGSIVWKTDIGSWPFGANAFKLSSDGKLLAAGGKVGEVTVIRTDEGRKIWQYDQQGAVTWLDFSPDGRYLLAGGGGQGATTLYETQSGRRIWRISQFSHQGKFSSDGQFILIGDRDLRIVDLFGNELVVIAPDDQGKQVGQGQFAYISKDAKRIIFTRRDIEPGAAGVIFVEGRIETKTLPQAELQQILSPEEKGGVVSPTEMEETGKAPEAPEIAKRKIFQKIWERLMSFFRQIFSF